MELSGESDCYLSNIITIVVENILWSIFLAPYSYMMENVRNLKVIAKAAMLHFIIYILIFFKFPNHYNKSSMMQEIQAILLTGQGIGIKFVSDMLISDYISYIVVYI